MLWQWVQLSLRLILVHRTSKHQYTEFSLFEITTTTSTTIIIIIIDIKMSLISMKVSVFIAFLWCSVLFTVLTVVWVCSLSWMYFLNMFSDYFSLLFCSVSRFLILIWNSTLFCIFIANLAFKFLFLLLLLCLLCHCHQILTVSSSSCWHHRL